MGLSSVKNEKKNQIGSKIIKHKKIFMDCNLRQNRNILKNGESICVLINNNIYFLIHMSHEGITKYKEGEGESNL